MSATTSLATTNSDSATPLGSRAAIHSSAPTCRSTYLVWKGVIDRFLGAVLLIPGLPLMGILIALVRLASPGPGVYRQVRVGCGGKTYTMFKLRSMRIDAEAGSGAVWAQHGDPRVTRLGYWLRKLHLDELPQLINVIRGEMSLIGPRPERPEFVHLLAREIPGYLSRLDVLPGITGLAQINLPPDRDLDDVRRKLVLDREYIESAGLFLDLRILLCTLLRVIGIRGDIAMHCLRLRRAVAIPTALTQMCENELRPAATVMEHCSSTSRMDVVCQSSDSGASSLVGADAR